MIVLITKKILYLFIMLWLISLISFGIIHLAPNSFFDAGGLNPNITPEAIAHLKSVYGLDKPWYIQYLLWLKSIVLFDFGISFVSGNRVIDEIGMRVWITLGMNIVAMILVFWLGVWLGVKSALNDRPLYKQLALVSYAMPSFYLALLFLLFFGYTLGWFPLGGIESFEPKKGFAKIIDTIHHFVLPIGVMVFVGFGSLLLYVRSLTLDILKSDYIFFARTRGVMDKQLKKIYIYPNLLPFVITILGLSLPGLLGGSVILEQIFSINGMGLLFYQSALSRDYPVIMGILIIGAFLTLLGNLIADALLLKLDPSRKKAT